MSNIEIFGSKSDFNTIEYNFHINEKCNLGCFYCSHKDTNKYNSNGSQFYNKQLNFIEKTFEQPYNIIMDLQGGEPTLHPNFTDIVNFCLLKKKQTDELRITTNLLDISNIKDFINNDFSISVSIHNYSFKIFEKVLNNILFLKNKNINISTTLSILNKIDKLEYYKKIKNQLEKLNINITPQYIYIDENKEVDYNNEIKDFINTFNKNEHLVYHFKNSDVVTKDWIYYIANSKLNFCGWYCFQNKYKVSEDCIISPLCGGKLRNPDIPLKCTKLICNEKHFIENVKVKNFKDILKTKELLKC